MKTLIVFLCFFTAIALAQEESRIEIKDNLFKVSLFHNISLSDNLTFQNGLSIRNNIDFVTLEVPILIKHDLSNDWSTSFGLETRTVIYSNFPGSFNFGKPLNSYLLIGTEYKFKHNATGNFTIGFPFDVQLGLKF